MQSIKNNVAWLLAGALALLLAASWSGIAFSGPLDPPGAPAPSMKTLQQVEPRTPISSLPYVITARGSYYLTSDLSGGSSDGISINTSGVTLDLNGFALYGDGFQTSDGIAGGAFENAISILNGRVIGWRTGITFPASSRDVHIDRIQAANNGTGIFVASPTSRITDCSATDNTGLGITTAAGVSIAGCSATGNGSWGFNLGDSNAISDCIASSNGGGIVTGASATIANCTVTGNSGAGIAIGDHGRIESADVTLNKGDGITAQSYSQISNTTSSANGGMGISLSGESNVVSDCVASGNTATGIQIASGSTVENCSVLLNSGNGMQTDGRVLIRHNHVRRNGSVGIVFSGLGGKFEGNEASDNLSGGIVAAFGASGAIVVKNTASGNGATFGNFQLNTFFTSVSYGPMNPAAADGAWANITY